MDKEPRAPKTAVGHVALLAAGSLLAPLGARAALLIEGRVDIGGGDLRGVLADLAMAFVLATVILLANRRHRWVGLALVIAWGVLNYGNYEHVTALGAVARLQHAGYMLDATFVLGSVLAPTRPLLLAGILAASCLLIWLGSRTVGGRVAVISTTTLALIALGGLLLWAPDGETLTWRQTHVVLENLAAGTGYPAPEPPGAVAAGVLATAEREVDALYRSDLDGEPIVELGRTGTNVLLIVLEGTSGAHLDSIAGRLGVTTPIRLPRLDRVARQHVLFRSFVSQQRQTNRGEYAALCGDPPKLVTDEPKMSQALDGAMPICLPEVLRRAGYETVYLQAAPLGFMSKDRFMPRIGYSRVHGEEWFAEAYARSRWGLDDRAFFEQSLEMVRRLRDGGKPWFLTLLTVGTHHPYIVPKAYGKSSFATAAAYLDTAFEQLLEGIRVLGILDRTLVLITSDESVGISGYRGASAEPMPEGIDDLTKKLSDNWGLLIAMLPAGENLQIDEEFMQSDLELSVLDYLGLANPTAPPGRSVFRAYDRRRPVVFGNVYKSWLGVLGSSRRLSLCSEDFTDCATYDLSGGHLFSPDRTRGEVDPVGVETLRAAAARSAGARAGPRRIQLLSRPLVPIRAGHDVQVIFGGQYLSVPARTRIDVDLEVEAVGRAGEVALGHSLKSEGRGFLFSKQMPPLRPGDRVTIRYSFTVSEDLHYVESLAMAQRRAPGELALAFRTARMSLSPVAGSREALVPGLQVHEVRVRRRGRAAARAPADGGRLSRRTD